MVQRRTNLVGALGSLPLNQKAIWALLAVLAGAISFVFALDDLRRAIRLIPSSRFSSVSNIKVIMLSSKGATVLASK